PYTPAFNPYASMSPYTAAVMSAYSMGAYSMPSYPYSSGYGASQPMNMNPYNNAYNAAPAPQTSYVAPSGGYGGSRYAASPQSGVVEVGVYDDSFQPNLLTVTAGSTVRWTNVGKHMHTVTSNTGLWPSARLVPGANHSYTFSAPG